MPATAEALAVNSVLEAIIDGHLDNGFEAIHEAIKNRRKAIATRTLLLLKEGTRVQLTGLRPAYLNGLQGVVTGRKNSRISVKLDRPEVATRFAINGVLQVPAGTIREI